MADFTIDAMIYRDGRLIGSAYGAGNTMNAATHMVTSDLANFDANEEASDG